MQWHNRLSRVLSPGTVGLSHHMKNIHMHMLVRWKRVKTRVRRVERGGLFIFTFWLFFLVFFIIRSSLDSLPTEALNTELCKTFPP